MSDYRKFRGLSQLVVNQLCDEMEKFYFCGMPLCVTFASRFFQRYGQYVGRGFCYTVSALVMFCLKGNRTAHIVWGNVSIKGDPEVRRHSWVEFKRFGLWWVADFSWYSPGAIIWRPLYRFDLSRGHGVERVTKIKVTKIHSYEKFWNIPVTALFYRNLQQSETSWLFYEIYIAYTKDSNSKAPDFGKVAQTEKYAQIIDHKSLGKYVRFGSWANFDDTETEGTKRAKMFSKRIFYEFILNPNRLQPKGHTERKARAVNHAIMAKLEEMRIEGSITSHQI